MQNFGRNRIFKKLVCWFISPSIFDVSVSWLHAHFALPCSTSPVLQQSRMQRHIQSGFGNLQRIEWLRTETIQVSSGTCKNFDPITFFQRRAATPTHPRKTLIRRGELLPSTSCPLPQLRCLPSCESTILPNRVWCESNFWRIFYWKFVILFRNYVKFWLLH